MSHKTLVLFALVGALLFLAQRGNAQEAGSIHPSWPIQNGVKHQPTQSELNALHDQDVTPNDAREVDRLYNETHVKQLSWHAPYRNRTHALRQPARRKAFQAVLGSAFVPAASRCFCVGL